jgi:hypothetical protein
MKAKNCLRSHRSIHLCSLCASLRELKGKDHSHLTQILMKTQYVISCHTSGHPGMFGTPGTPSQTRYQDPHQTSSPSHINTLPNRKFSWQSACHGRVVALTSGASGPVRDSSSFSLNSLNTRDDFNGQQGAMGGF